MTKATLLSASGDPFILLFFFKLFWERWYDEVDHLYLSYNNYAQVPEKVVTELFSNLNHDSKITIIYNSQGIGAGKAIIDALKIATEDLVVLLEEDTYIFTPDKIRETFEQIELDKFDALGSPRFSCGQEISDSAKVLYNLDYSGYGDQGPNFWPSLFFCKREDLLKKTRQNFDAFTFEKGVYYPELNHTMSEQQIGDTFVVASLQLRYNGLRIGSIPQFHSSPYEIEEFQKRERNWMNGKPYWLHAGSLSTGAEQYLKNNLPPINSEIDRLEFESRVAFWTLTSKIVEGFEDYKYSYQQGIEKLINNAGLDRDNIGKKIAIYKGLIDV